jgi:uncharacterized membrane protein
MDGAGFAFAMTLGGAVLQFAVAYPLHAGRVRRNALYGFRTPRTLSDDRVWYPANKAAGRNMMVSAVVTAVASPLILMAGNDAALVVAALSINLAPLLGSTFASMIALSRIP